MPRITEKELFTVIVHENQFVVSALRIYELLQPPKPYQQWLQLALYSSLLKENEDYFSACPGMVSNKVAMSCAAWFTLRNGQPASTSW